MIRSSRSPRPASASPPTPAPCSPSAAPSRATATDKGERRRLTGAVATLESLYEIDPDARQADGTTVGQAAKAIERRLRACHATKAARRVAKLSG